MVWTAVLVLTLLPSFVPALLHAQPLVSSPVQQAAADLDSAKSQQVDLLSPKAYAKAVDGYRRLVDLVRRGRPDAEVKPAIQQFRQALETATKNTAQGKASLGEALAARSRAIAANAPEVAAKEYQNAQATFTEAVARLEENDAKGAQKTGKEAAVKYRQAEANAVRVNLLGAARVKVAEAKSRKAEEYAPKTYGQAQALIREIEAAVEKGNVSLEELQAKASLAEYEARHAIYLATVLDTLRRNNANWERLLLDQEQIVSRIADAMGVRPTFEHGVQTPVDSIIRAIQQGHDAFTKQLVLRDAEVTLRDAEVARLSRTIDSLQTVFDQYQTRLAAMIEQYQTDLQTRKEELELKRRELEVELRKKMQLDAIDQAQSTFLKNEALVVREGKSLVIRLVGLNFASGAAALPKDAPLLLDKVGKVLALFPRSRASVEGHTAATGDEKANLAQSEARARAVREYLVSKAFIPDTRITATGFGGAKPIADNLTPQGRAQNRRVDVVITLDE